MSPMARRSCIALAMRPDRYRRRRIRGKGVTVHKGVGLVRIGATVNLKLHPIPIRIPVIDGQRQTVMNLPVRRYAKLLETVISLEQCSEIRVGITDMINTDTARVIILNTIGTKD